MLDEMFDLEGIIAPFGKRAAAFLVDYGIGCAICAVIWVFLHHWLAVIGMAYVLVRDGLPGGQSIGKRLLGLQVVGSSTGQPCNLLQSVIRNLPIVLGVFVPVELVVAAMSPESFRVGDYLSGTFVIEKEKARAQERAGVDLSHPTEGLERLSEITGMDVDTSLKLDAPALQSDAPVGVVPKISPQPYDALALRHDAGRDEIDDAYWGFMNKYSDDVVRDLGSEELDQRCRELLVRFQKLDMRQLGVNIAYNRKLSDKEKRQFIHQHVVALNNARDSLLQ